MSPRLRIPLILAAIALACVGLWWRPARPPQPKPVPVSASPAETGAGAAPRESPSPVFAHSPTPRPPGSAPRYSTAAESRLQQAAAASSSPPPLTPLPAHRTPETETRKIKFLVRDYRAAHGENPVGSNAEITRALLGKNPRGIKFLDPAALGLAISPAGELLDSWGHPYFFHAVSGTQMEVRSAGPDGLLFTADDVIVP